MRAGSGPLPRVPGPRRVDHLQPYRCPAFRGQGSGSRVRKPHKQAQPGPETPRQRQGWRGATRCGPGTRGSGLQQVAGPGAGHLPEGPRPRTCGRLVAARSRGCQGRTVWPPCSPAAAAPCRYQRTGQPFACHPKRPIGCRRSHRARPRPQAMDRAVRTTSSYRTLQSLYGFQGNGVVPQLPPSSLHDSPGAAGACAAPPFTARSSAQPRRAPRPPFNLCPEHNVIATVAHLLHQSTSPNSPAVPLACFRDHNASRHLVPHASLRRPRHANLRQQLLPELREAERVRRRPAVQRVVVGGVPEPHMYSEPIMVSQHGLMWVRYSKRSHCLPVQSGMGQGQGG